MLNNEAIRNMTGLATASEYQMNIFRHGLAAIEAYSNGDTVDNCVVQAVAGSGKTTTIVGFSNLIPTTMNAIFLAFNKSIADELKERLPQHVQARTLNSLGFGILRKYVEETKVRNLPPVRSWTAGNKTWKIIRDTFDRVEVSNYGKDIAFLVAKAKSFGIVSADLEGQMVDGVEYRSANGLRDEKATWDHIVSHFGHTLDYASRDKVYAMASQVLSISIQTLALVDFDDQKYLPVVMFPNGKPMKARKFDAIIVDEVQDVNAIDILLARLSLKKNGVVMGVGDANQAIYGFRGASTDAVAKFASEFGCSELPLTVSYRCSKAVVNAARAVHETIEHADNAPEGLVEGLDKYTSEVFSARNEDMVICRNNAPIVDFAYKLIRARVPVYVKGRDIGKGLISLVEQMKANNVSDLSSKLNIWVAQQTDIILSNDPDDEEAVERMLDRVATIKVFVEHNVDGRVDSVINDIESLFNTSSSDKKESFDIKGKVVLSTMHKSKGLEADHVFILNPGLLYPRYISEGTWQWDQEKNLEYVAITRAKTTLTYIEADGFVS